MKLIPTQLFPDTKRLEKESKESVEQWIERVRRWCQDLIRILDNVNVNIPTIESVINEDIITEHSKLSQLGYASSGHTGFEPALTKGNLTVSNPLNIDNTRQVVGGNAQISIPKATGSTDGYIDKEDFTNFQEAYDRCIGTAVAKDIDTVYQADTDGFIEISDTSAGIPTAVVYADTSNPPIKIRATGYKPSAGQVAITCFVRTGEYWKGVVGTSKEHLNWYPYD